MKELIIPSKLNEGDTIAFISISGGRAGDEDMLPRYLMGKRRFEKIFNVKVIETPHALKGSSYLYDHPEKRAEFANQSCWILYTQAIVLKKPQVPMPKMDIMEQFLGKKSKIYCQRPRKVKGCK